MTPTKKAVVLGGAGDVGKGIVAALESAEFELDVIDPQINKKHKSLKKADWRKLLKNTPLLVHAADSGDRSAYSKHPEYDAQNQEFLSRLARIISDVNPEVVLWYVGGCWTKLKPNRQWIIADKSPNKPLSECDPYEIAKIHAEKKSRELSIKHKIKIRYFNWTSVVPNFSKNFPINKMVEEALDKAKVTYTPGFYGQPLLDAENAGEVLLKIIEHDGRARFKKYLIPGIFISFSTFAYMVRRIVGESTGKTIELVKQEEAPDFSRSTTESDYLTKLEFKLDKNRTLASLEEGAVAYLNTLS